MFSGLRSLETLILSRNPIAFISPSTFAVMSSLHVLVVNKAKLVHVRPGGFDGLVSLRSLSLNDNSMRQLPDRLFAGLRSLRKVNTHRPTYLDHHHHHHHHHVFVMRLGVVVRASDLQPIGRRFESRSLRFTKDPSKFFTHMCLCSPSSINWYRPMGGDRPMLCGWEGNRRSGVALAMHHRLSGITTYTYGLNV